MLYGFFLLKLWHSIFILARKNNHYLHKLKWPTTDEKNMWVQKMGSVDGNKRLSIVERCSVLGSDSCDGATVWVLHLDIWVYLCTCWRKQSAPPAEVGRRMPSQVGTSMSSDERGGHGIRPWLSRSKEFKRLRLIGHWSRSWTGSFQWRRRSNTVPGFVGVVHFCQISE